MIGINGTPSFIVQGTFMPGMLQYDVLQEAVDKAREQL